MSRVGDVRRNMMKPKLEAIQPPKDLLEQDHLQDSFPSSVDLQSVLNGDNDEPQEFQRSTPVLCSEERTMNSQRADSMPCSVDTVLFSVQAGVIQRCQCLMNSDDIEIRQQAGLILEEFCSSRCKISEEKLGQLRVTSSCNNNISLTVEKYFGNEMMALNESTLKKIISLENGKGFLTPYSFSSAGSSNDRTSSAASVQDMPVVHDSPLSDNPRCSKETKSEIKKWRKKILANARSKYKNPSNQDFQRIAKEAGISQKNVEQHFLQMKKDQKEGKRQQKSKAANKHLRSGHAY